MCGVKVGLFFPRSTLATTAERRPRGTSVASTTYHLRSTWPGLAMNVVLFMSSPIRIRFCLQSVDVPVHELFERFRGLTNGVNNTAYYNTKKSGSKSTVMTNLF